MSVSAKCQFKLWLSTDSKKGAFGDGKWRLLRAVNETGSLKAASDELGISYRKAWGDLKKAEESLGINLFIKKRGGNAGGNTVLTDTGKKWLVSYSQFRTDINKAVDIAYQKHIEKLFFE